MRFLLLLAVLSVFFLSCSRESPEPLWEPEALVGSKEYRGGLFPVWITLKEPVENEGSIDWKRGKNTRIAYRTQARNAKDLIIADTAYLYWEEPPEPFVKIDSTEIKRDTVKSWKIDTTYYYRDTICAVIDNRLESMPIIIEVKNILPRIKSITVNGVEQQLQPGDSLLTIAASPGNTVDILIKLEKKFSKNRPDLRIEGYLKYESDSDSLWVYKWSPTGPIVDSSIYLRVKDTGGYGERLYKVYLVAYTESSSIWVATENELVKYSPEGIKVARIDGFNSISDITVNSNDGRLFVIDQSGNSFFIYDTYGKSLYRDSSFKAPTSVAVSVEDGSIWVADAEGLNKFEFNGAEFSSTASYELSGPIRGLSVNQYGGNSGGKNFVWFAIPQSDTVGLIRDIKDTVLQTPEFISVPEPDHWNRPSMISHDPATGIAWVADSTRIVAIDADGKILVRIKNFRFVTSVSASGGNVWASDVHSGKVYRFKGPFSASAQQPLELTVAHGIPADDVFFTPVSVSAFTADGSAWVVDRDLEKVVRLDSLGKQIASGTGLKLPRLGITIQKRE